VPKDAPSALPVLTTRRFLARRRTVIEEHAVVEVSGDPRSKVWSVRHAAAEKVADNPDALRWTERGREVYFSVVKTLDRTR
jgi:hypothetical protein